MALRHTEPAELHTSYGAGAVELWRDGILVKLRTIDGTRSVFVAIG